MSIQTSIFDIYFNLLLRIQNLPNLLSISVLHLVQQKNLTENAAYSEYEMTLQHAQPRKKMDYFRFWINYCTFAP